MSERPANPEREVNLTRLAWLVSIAAPVVLIALLCLAKAATSGAAELPVPEPVGETLPEDECIEWEEEVIECEPAEEEPAEPGGVPPEECILRSARARVLSYATRNRLRLVVHYSTVAPTRAYLDFRMRGGAGSMSLGVVRRHLGLSGVLRLNERLGEAQMERAREASDYVLTLDIPAAPGYCESYFTRRLALRRSLRGRTVWLQSDQALGGAR
jgi:hypothetical protein